MAPKRKAGQPEKSPDEKKKPWAMLRCDAAERATFAAAAKLAGMKVATWMRDRLRVAARRELEDRGKPVPLDVQ